MMESTYGAPEDSQPTRKESEDFLVNSVKEKVEEKGKVLIPVLGVGRAQEIMLIVEQAITKMQFQAIAKTTGIDQWERYLSSQETTNWEGVGVKWITEGAEPA